MRSPAAAIAWELTRRHRWGFAAVAGYLLLLAAYRLLVLEPGADVTFADSRSFAFAVVVPMSTTYMYFLAVFSFGLGGDLGARRSMYPERMFTLPVPTAALAGWPMLYGALATVTLWTLGRSLGPWPTELSVPWLWPPILAVAILAWTQALTWMPYGLPGARVVVAILLLVTIDAVVIVAHYYEASELLMLALLGPHLPIAYLVACSAVARARRGHVPDWRVALGGLGRARPGRRFSSPAQAQEWYEWLRFGRSLPLLVAILLPVELLLLVPFGETPSVVRATLAAALLTPPFLASFVAATVARSNPGR